MNLVTYNITLDYHEIEAQAILFTKEADTARRIKATLSEDGDPYEIAPACNALFTAHKPNGGVVTLNCDIVDNTIICDITEAITALPGKVDCEIKLYDATGDMLTSPKFGIIVDKAVFNNGDNVEEGGEYPAIIYAVGIEKVEQTVTSTEDGGANIVTITLSDGSSKGFTFKNGSRGSPGQTPVKGIDYYTQQDKSEMVDAVLDALPSVTFIAGDNIDITNNVISVITSDVAEEDNTKPITASAVHTIVGNIETILETI